MLMYLEFHTRLSKSVYSWLETLMFLWYMNQLIAKNGSNTNDEIEKGKYKSQLMSYLWGKK
jgi:hypothetical protein